MFNVENGGQIAWLLPLAAICFVALAVHSWHRRDRLQLGATTVLGLWLAVHALVFSFVEGIYHPYYTAALAPAIAALIGAGAAVLWQNRHSWQARGASAAGVIGSGWLALVLLDRDPSWNPWLGPTTLALSAAAALIITGLGPMARLLSTARRPAEAAAFVFSVVVVLLAPASYATATITSPPSQLPHAGPGPVPMSPAVLGFKTANQTSAELVDYLWDQREGERWVVASLGSSTGASLIIDLNGAPVMVMGGFTGLDDPVPTVAELDKYVSTGQLRFILVPTRRGSPEASKGAPPTNGPTGTPRQTSHLIEAVALIVERYKWMAYNCTPVDPAAIGGPALDSRLYDCARPPNT
jgi:4-amino-4-deoxy-L-arabinose transferase-like glycosyltransferase